MSGDEKVTLEAARRGDEDAFARLIGPYRRELRAHCYRLSGSLCDADDLLQESLLRVWRGLGSFEGRSSLRTWLFTVTTHACLDALEKRPARLLPMDMGPAMAPGETLAPPRLEPIWIEPWPDVEDKAAYASPKTPEAHYTLRESVTLAFIVALQLLPPKQRAVLLLRDVLGWQARECADLLELSVAAVNSALQRARETIERRAPSLHDTPAEPDVSTLHLVTRYVDAWEASDIDALVSLLRDDAILAMPPLPQWVQGAAAIGASIGGMVLVPGSRGMFRMATTRMNGQPVLALYRRDDEAGTPSVGGHPHQVFRPLSLHFLEIVDGRIASIVAFLDTTLFARCGLPAAFRFPVKPLPGPGEGIL